MKFYHLCLRDHFYEYWPILKQLRPHLNEESTLSLGQSAERANGYKLLGLRQEDGDLIGLMGYRTLYDFVHGAHLYIDDLVIDEGHRGNGLGALFLREAERMAKMERLNGIRLCTGLENHDGRRFYKREGYVERAVACKKLC